MTQNIALADALMGIFGYKRVEMPPEPTRMPILPLKLISVLNVREHWSKRADRAKLHRSNAHYYLLAQLGTQRPVFPVLVTITRVAPRELDGDNLQGACKAIRDGIADYFLTDDRNPQIEWQYGQEKAKDYGVRIDVVSKPKTA